MNKFRFLLILTLSLTLLAACSTDDTADSPASSVTTTENGTTLELTLEELAQYDGQNGNPAYIAVDGIIYDVTDIGVWENGMHNGFQAGRDFSNEFPHDQSRLDLAERVGMLIDGPSNSQDISVDSPTDDSENLLDDSNSGAVSDDSDDDMMDASDDDHDDDSDDDHDDDSDDDHDDDSDDDHDDDSDDDHDDDSDDDHDDDSDDDHDDDSDDDHDDDSDDDHDDDSDDDMMDDSDDDRDDDSNDDHDDDSDDDRDDDHDDDSDDDVSDNNSQLRIFTESELAQYNGKDGNLAYIAFEGFVYDVSRLSLWSGGEHNGIQAGYDLTDDIGYAPHGAEMLERAELIGILE